MPVAVFVDTSLYQARGAMSQLSVSAVTVPVVAGNVLCVQVIVMLTGLVNVGAAMS